MRKIICLCLSLVLMSLSTTVHASLDIINTQGSITIKGMVSSGELDYATEATVTVFDEDGNLNYIDVIPVSKDGTAEFLYDNQGNSGDYEFYVDISAFNIIERATLEGFVGKDYWDLFISRMSGFAQNRAYDDLKTNLFAEKERGLLEFDDSLYNSLTDKDTVWVVMSEDCAAPYQNVDEILKGFQQAVYLCKMNEANDAAAWYEFMKESLGSVIPLGESGIVIDEYTVETKTAVLASIANTDYSKTTDASEALLKAGLFKAIENAYHYTDVKSAVKAYYNAGYITANPQNITENQYKNAKGSRVNSYSDVNSLFVTSGTIPNGGSNIETSFGGGAVSHAPAVLQPISETVSEQSGKMTFSDMEDAKWALKQVELLYEKGIINGTGDGMYSPHKNVTRAEMAKMLVILGGYDIVPCDIPFNDVDPNAWYYPYICTAYQNGIFNGISGNEFGVDRNITRQEQAVVLYRLLAQKQVEMSQDSKGFADEENIGSWARDAVYSLRQKGIVSGRGGNLFCPNEAVTRAEAAVFIANAYSHIL